jgi:hypothetical protein
MLTPSGKAVCNTSKRIEPIVDGRSTTYKRKSTLLNFKSEWMQKISNYTKVQSTQSFTHTALLISKGTSLVCTMMNAYYSSHRKIICFKTTTPGKYNEMKTMAQHLQPHSVYLNLITWWDHLINIHAATSAVHRESVIPVCFSVG